VQRALPPPHLDQPIQLDRPRPGAQGAENSHRQVGEAPPDGPQPRDRARIRPLQVLDDDRQRPLQGTFLDPFDQPIDDAELRPHHATRGERHVRRDRQRRAQRAERTAAIQLISAASENPERARRGARAHHVGQRRLPDPGLTLDQRARRSALPHLLQPPLERLTLGDPSNHPRVRRRGHQFERTGRRPRKVCAPGGCLARHRARSLRPR
jgi:hypothetical protein